MLQIWMRSLPERLVVERSTRGGLRASRIYRAIWILEALVEDLGCEDPHFSRVEEVFKDPLEIGVRGCEAGREEVRIFVEDLERSSGVGIRVSLSAGRGPGISELYPLLVEEILEDLRILIRPYALETASRGGVEYMAVLLDEGRWIVLEGERHAVRAPQIEGSIAMAHTHPLESCLPSRPDLESCLELFSGGGVLCSVASVSCIFSLEVRSPFSEEDFRALMRAINGYDDFLQDLLRSLGSHYQAARARISGSLSASLRGL